MPDADVRLTAAQLADLADSLTGEIVLERLLEDVVATARAATGARYAALGVIDETGSAIETFVHTGMDASTVAAIGPPPTGGGLLGELIAHPYLIRLDDLTDHPSSTGFPPEHPPMGSFLGAPIRVGGAIFGNLYLTEKAGGFDEADEEAVAVLAVQAGLAINAATAAQTRQRLAIQSERERISRDLHDGVIQTLFSVGMGLEAARAQLPTDREAADARIAEMVDRLDDTVIQIRQTIFGLRQITSDTSLPVRLHRLIEEYGGHGVRIREELSLAPADVPDGLVPDILHIVREALSNAVRHGGAAEVAVRAQVARDVLAVEVVDDGCGFDATTVVAGNGLRNMAERVAVLAGALDVVSGEDGTRITLTVPIREA